MNDYLSERCCHYSAGRGGLPLCLVLVFVLLSSVPTMSVVAAGQPALVAIIIDDLGNQLGTGRRTIALDAPLACAVMPHTAYGARLAAEAHAAGKEVMLHLPMQPTQMDRIAGPGEISLENSIRQLRDIVASDLSAVPHAIGVNNHMGSLITRHPGHMRWLMDELAARGDLFFVDSMTTPGSVAYAAALERGVPAARRHVFLDDDPDTQQIELQFERLLQQARERGFAIGIGHPYASTLDFLEQALPQLQQNPAFKLVPVSYVVAELSSGQLQRELISTQLNLAAAREHTY